MKLSEKLIASGVVPPTSPQSLFQKAFAKEGVPETSELRRVRDLPRRVLDIPNAPDLTPLWLKPNALCPGCDLCGFGTREPKLLPEQSATLLEAERCNGAIGQIGVGKGKAGISFLLPEALTTRCAVVLLPPELRAQTLRAVVPMWQRHFNLPKLCTHSPRAHAEPNRRCNGVLHFVAYSILSSPTQGDVLEWIKPDVLVLDEAHSLARRSSSRTKRFYRYLKNRPSTRVVAMSGTLAKSSLRDYGDLSAAALAAGSPLPRTFTDLVLWDRALPPLDDGQEPEVDAGALLQLCEPDENVQSGFARRFAETPGVVSTQGEDGVSASLVIEPRALTVPEQLGKAIKAFGATWKIADEEVEDALTFARVARQLSAGFFYRWKWPSGSKDSEWLEARAAWHKEVREELRYSSRPGHDSPFLLAGAAARGAWNAATWKAWAAVKDRYKPHPAVETVWIDDYLVRDAVAWAHEQQDDPAIIWYEHRAIGEAIAKLGGFPLFDGGTDRELLAAAQLRRDDKGARVIVCSLRSHGTGKNLQRYSRALVTTPPGGRSDEPSSAGKTWEQMLGRQHRRGTLADVVRFDVYTHTEALLSAWNKARRESRWIETTLRTRQKLNYAAIGIVE